MSKLLEVVCIKDCESLGGAKFYQNKIYKAQFFNKSCYIFNENNETLRLDVENPFHKDIISKYFTTLTEQRKNKLNKLNEK